MQQAALEAFLATNLVVEEIRRVAGGDLSVQPIVPKVARLQRLMSARGCTFKSVTGFNMLEWENSRTKLTDPEFSVPAEFCQTRFDKIARPNFRKLTKNDTRERIIVV
jgi:hypothetical protein